MQDTHPLPPCGLVDGSSACAGDRNGHGEDRQRRGRGLARKVLDRKGVEGDALDGTTAVEAE